MKKIEIIWRELLFEGLERQKQRFTQKELAKKFGVSTSTVNQALKQLRAMGAVRVGGRYFLVEDAEKILYHWANHRNLKADLIYQTRVEAPVMEIEGLLPGGAIPTTYTAVRERLGEAPADYDKVYFYAEDLKEVRRRFPASEKTSNLFVLKADKFLKNYGEVACWSQAFVDLWNLSDWYAKEFVRRVKEEINGLLS
jgi:transcriptional regulator with XRE-family HTH domain